MEIDKASKGEFGDFKIVESTDKRILQKFIDAETGMLIVSEQDKESGQCSITMVHPQSGEIIEVKQRKKYISYKALTEQDETLNIRWKKKRVPWPGGGECFEFDIWLPNQKKPVKWYRLAFSDKPLPTIAEWYRNHMEKQAENNQEIAEYQKKSYPEKVSFGRVHCTRKCAGMEKAATMNMPYSRKIGWKIPRQP